MKINYNSKCSLVRHFYFDQYTKFLWLNRIFLFMFSFNFTYSLTRRSYKRRINFNSKVNVIENLLYLQNCKILNYPSQLTSRIIMQILLQFEQHNYRSSPALYCNWWLVDRFVEKIYCSIKQTKKHWNKSVCLNIQI